MWDLAQNPQRILLDEMNAAADIHVTTARKAHACCPQPHLHNVFTEAPNIHCEHRTLHNTCNLSQTLVILCEAASPCWSVRTTVCMYWRVFMYRPVDALKWLCIAPSTFAVTNTLLHTFPVGNDCSCRHCYKAAALVASGKDIDRDYVSYTFIID